VNDLLEAAIAAAHVAGETILASGVNAGTESKGTGDYVTVTDRAAEEAIAASLRTAHPRIPLVGEERGGVPADRYWLVDPLDGTANFLHRFPVVGVSIALIQGGRPVVGVVHAPFLGETFWATAGGGSFAERRGSTKTLSVSARLPSEAVLATGFPFRRKQLVPRHLAAVRACLERFEDLRRPGAASLDLAWVAAGVFEGFFELNLSPWDVAAGALLVEEAGGVVSDWEGGPNYLSGNIVAAAPPVQAARVEITYG
jgi:myo-inositol-1(or 4)-monophosphatase